MKCLRTASLILLAGWWLGCHKAPEPEATKAPESTNPVAVTESPSSATNKSFLVRGVVKSIDLPDNSITVQHEKIPD